MYIGLHIKYRYCCGILIKLEVSGQIFEKISNGFHENPASGSRVVPCGQTDRMTDMMKLMVAFHNFAEEPNNCCMKYFF
jgi:hypothetical protein